MKEGYIVWNESTGGSEFFGVYKNYKTAERQLRKVIRTRYGHCPRDLDKLAEDPYIDDGYSSYGIHWFKENIGKE